MGIFNFWSIEQRDSADVAVQNNNNEEELDVLLNGRVFDTRITREQAMSIPAVASAINIISGIIAGLPVKLMQRNEEGLKEIANDARLTLLNLDTGGIIGAYEMKKSLITDYLLDGEGAIFVDKRGNNINTLQYLPYNNYVMLTNGRVINRAIMYQIEGRKYRYDEVMRVVHNSVNGYKGQGIIDENPVLLSTMYNALIYENGAMSKGGKKGFLKSENRLTQAMLDALKKAWNKLYSNNNSDVIVLNKGVSFEAADSTATENQLNENKQTNSEQIYKLFGLANDTFTNNDAFNVFVKTALVPIMNNLTECFNRFLLLEKEKGDFYFAFDMKDLIKSDMLSRYQAYQIALEKGWLTIDEIRAYEDLEPLGIEFVKLGLDSVLYYPKENKVYTPNTGIYADFDSMNEKGGVNSESRIEGQNGQN